MKFISWNVNGLRACVQKGFTEYFQETDADFFCLQETKLQEGQIDFSPEGYYCYWNYAVKKGYSGTAIFTKKKPLTVAYGIGIEEHDQEGRVITLEYENFYMVTVYTPNSQSELARLDYRMKWEDDFRAYLKKLDEKKPVIMCGDLNVAHREIDLKIQKPIEEMQVLQTKKEANLQNFWKADLQIPSAIFIRRKREFIPGGPIVLRPEKRTQDGALTISARLKDWKISWLAQPFTQKFWAQTIVR